MGQRRRVGDFLKVQFEPEWHTYARVLVNPLFAFYDARTKADLSLDQIQASPILFRIWVMKYAVTSGRWSVVGNRTVVGDLLKSPRFCKQDPITKEIFTYRDTIEYPATIEQCAGLEVAAVWDPEHVEERLADHYARRPNKWVESLKMKL